MSDGLVGDGSSPEPIQFQNSLTCFVRLADEKCWFIGLSACDPGCLQFAIAVSYNQPRHLRFPEQVLLVLGHGFAQNAVAPIQLRVDACKLIAKANDELIIRLNRSTRTGLNINHGNGQQDCK